MMDKDTGFHNEGFDCEGFIRAESVEEAVAQAKAVLDATEIADDVTTRVRATVHYE